MKKLILPIIIAMALIAGAAFAEENKANEALAAGNKSILRISAFITAGDVIQYLDTPEKLAKIAAALKPLGVTRVFLDNYRGVIPDSKTLIQARDYLRGAGFEVGAGITTVNGKDFGVPSPTHRYFFCYDNDKTRNDMKMISEYAASLFDEIIVDDFFATECRCKECAVTKGSRSWDQYFRDVLVGISQDQVVRPAHSKNPKASVIIKYPQWYDRFHTFGYDLSREPGIFDLVWAGTETRDPEKENVMQYQAFVNYSWIHSIAGEKLRGGWFDQYNCSPETYLEQAYQTVLAGAPEITLFIFSPDNFDSANGKLFKEKLPFLFETAKAIKGIRPNGIYAYKPINSNGGGENYIFDYLGMFGIPVLTTANFPVNAKSIILTEHAAADPDIAAKIKTAVANGATVMLTTGLIEKLKKNEEILKLAGINPGVKKLKGKFSNTYIIDDAETVAPGYIEVGVRMSAVDAKVLAYSKIDNEKFPILTVREIPGGGRIVVFPGTTFSFQSDADGLNIPYKILYINMLEKVAEIIRNFATGPLGVTMTMPTRVGSYLYESRYIALDNFNDSPADTTVKFDPEKTGCEVNKLTDINGGAVSQPDKNGTISLNVPTRSMRMFRIDSFVFNQNPSRTSWQEDGINGSDFHLSSSKSDRRYGEKIL
ncbi:MAG: hypothetical protein WCX65_17785, partial [bacterium]